MIDLSKEAEEFLKSDKHCKFYDYENLGYCDKCKSTNLFDAVDCKNKQCIPESGQKRTDKQTLVQFVEESKYVQAKIIQAQIDVLKPYLEWNTEVALSIQRDIDRFEQQLKQLENEI